MTSVISHLLTEQIFRKGVGQSYIQMCMNNPQANTAFKNNYKQGPVLRTGGAEQVLMQESGIATLGGTTPTAWSYLHSTRNQQQCTFLAQTATVLTGSVSTQTRLTKF